MINRICIGAWIVGASLAAAGCDESKPEPNAATSLTSADVDAGVDVDVDAGVDVDVDVDVDAADPLDPYVCEVVPTADAAAEGLELFPIVTLGEQSYGGVCSSTAQARQCWYTGPRSCEEGDCGGFRGSVDSSTGEYVLAGGQHMLCPYPCVRDEECPASTTGTARARCMLPPDFNPATDGGSCMLGCGSGETCPDGFVCIEPGLSFSRSNGEEVPAPAQCVQFHRLELHGESTPP